MQHDPSGGVSILLLTDAEQIAKLVRADGTRAELNLAVQSAVHSGGRSGLRP
jgi:hypothetical protein